MAVLDRFKRHLERKRVLQKMARRARTGRTEAFAVVGFGFPVLPLNLLALRGFGFVV